MGREWLRVLLLRSCAAPAVAFAAQGVARARDACFMCGAGCCLCCASCLMCAAAGGADGFGPRLHVLQSVVMFVCCLFRREALCLPSSLHPRTCTQRDAQAVHR